MADYGHLGGGFGRVASLFVHAREAVMSVGFGIVEPYRFLERLNGAVVLFVLREDDSEIEMRDSDTWVDGYSLAEERLGFLKFVAPDQDVRQPGPRLGIRRIVF